MANIVAFPQNRDRDWKEVRDILKSGFQRLPDGLGCFAECEHELRNAYLNVFTARTLGMPPLVVPGTLTDEQVQTITRHELNLSAAVNELIESERSRLIGFMLEPFYLLTYLRRNGLNK